MTRLEAGIAECSARMYEADAQWAARAKREGWPFIRGRFYSGGPECVLFQPPDRDADMAILATIWDASPPR